MTHIVRVNGTSVCKLFDEWSRCMCCFDFRVEDCTLSPWAVECVRDDSLLDFDSSGLAMYGRK